MLNIDKCIRPLAVKPETGKRYQWKLLRWKTPSRRSRTEAHGSGLFHLFHNPPVNAPGVPEIPQSVFEELLVNALIHRDYLVNATIRLFIFNDRIEIISPGHLPNNLTVEKIRSGISNIRNPILVSYAAKGLLPYRGLGSGIKRALEDWSDISFTDDREGSMFIATIHRKKIDDESAEESSQKTSQKIIQLMQKDPAITIAELAQNIGITERAIKMQIEKMKAQGRIQRIGPDKGGRWQVSV